jgi:hypothetical protein
MEAASSILYVSCVYHRHTVENLRIRPLQALLYGALVLDHRVQ